MSNESTGHERSAGRGAVGEAGTTGCEYGAAFGADDPVTGGRREAKFSIASSVTKTNGPLVHFEIEADGQEVRLALTPEQATVLATSLLTNAETARTMAALLDALINKEIFPDDRLPPDFIRKLMASLSGARRRAEEARMTAARHERG